MRALSICQPWASLLILGIKRLETRSWRTAHRGILAIHASRKFPATARALCWQEPFASWLHAAGLDADRLPFGAVLGTVRLVDCVLADEIGDIAEPERPLGDFSPGRWVWRLAEPVRLPVPIPARGRLGIFELPFTLEPYLRSA